MKIAILGAGSGACLTAAYLRRYHKTHCEIEIYHTKTISPEPVGQAALLLTTNLFFETYGNVKPFDIRGGKSIVTSTWLSIV